MRVSDGKSCGDGDAKRDGTSDAPVIPENGPGKVPGTEPGIAGIPLSDTGNVVKNSFAMRAIVSVSGQPAGTSRLAAGRLVERSESRFSGAPFCGSLVVMVAADFDVFERCDRVIDQNGGRAVERDQVGSDGAIVDAHE